MRRNLSYVDTRSVLWEALSAREHLRFYGRLKRVSEKELNDAVNEALDSVNLLRSGFADKPASTYSGGMKRRLSVAISLIGHSTVVFLDEPSTGLDPNSRRLLWEAIRKAKKTKAILLTSNPFASFSHEPAHSMEEAEALCDRVGIYSNGELLAVGHPREVLVSLFSV